MRKDVSKKKKKRSERSDSPTEQIEGVLNLVPLCSDSTDVMMPIAVCGESVLSSGADY